MPNGICWYSKIIIIIINSRYAKTLFQSPHLAWIKCNIHVHMFEEFQAVDKNMKVNTYMFRDAVWGINRLNIFQSFILWDRQAAGNALVLNIKFTFNVRSVNRDGLRSAYD